MAEVFPLSFLLWEENDKRILLKDNVDAKYSARKPLATLQTASFCRLFHRQPEVKIKTTSNLLQQTVTIN